MKKSRIALIALALLTVGAGASDAFAAARRKAKSKAKATPVAAQVQAAPAGGYIIEGTVEDVAEGDTIVLNKYENEQLIPLEKTVVRDRKFTFTGRQDTIVDRYITCNIGGRQYILDFYLENAPIKANINKNMVSATGTATNNINQLVREELDSIAGAINAAYKYLRTEGLTDELIAKGNQAVKDTEASYYTAIKRATKKYISTPVGVYLLKEMYRNNTNEENDSLLRHVPERYLSDPVIKKLKTRVERLKLTKIGEPYTDFSFIDSEGNARKLSQYVKPGTVVLLDFWASWCGPCRKEMPEIAQLYADYHDRGLEIIGISLDDDKDAWLKALSSFKPAWPQLSDLKGFKSEPAVLYGIQAIPHTIIINIDGTIAARELRGDQLRTAIEQLLPRK